MNGTWERLAAPVFVFVTGLWAGSFEWRLRNKVDKDRFGDLIERLDRIEDKIDRRNGKEDEKV